MEFSLRYVLLVRMSFRSAGWACNSRSKGAGA